MRKDLRNSSSMPSPETDKTLMITSKNRCLAWKYVKGLLSKNQSSFRLLKSYKTLIKQSQGKRGRAAAKLAISTLLSFSCF
jgi:hypothetical protein